MRTHSGSTWGGKNLKKKQVKLFKTESTTGCVDDKLELLSIVYRQPGPSGQTDDLCIRELQDRVTNDLY